MNHYSFSIKTLAARLRSGGKTYSEINKAIGKNIPKATMSYWLRSIQIPKTARITHIRENNAHLEKIRRVAATNRKNNRLRYLEGLIRNNRNLKTISQKEETQKIILCILYLGEGRKNPKAGSLVLGNANPDVIRLFLLLLRSCYKVKEDKFRVTVMCRADQDPYALRAFWSGITKIPLSQFYTNRVDTRSIGQPTKHAAYMGVCRIDYFSAEVLHDILLGSKVIVAGLLNSEIDISDFFRNS